MIEQMTLAWRFIFNNHPHGEEIMKNVMDTSVRITNNQFEIWFREAQAS